MVDSTGRQRGGDRPEPNTEVLVEKIRKWVENRRAEWEEVEWLDLVAKLYEDGHTAGISRKSLEDIRDSEKEAWLRAEEARRDEEARITQKTLAAAKEAELKQKAAEQASKRRQEEQLFEEIRSSPTIGLCKRYLRQYPEGGYIQKVNEALNRLQNRRKNLLQTAKKTALLIAFLASVCFIGFIAVKTFSSKKDETNKRPNIRILWLTTSEDPATSVDWNITKDRQSPVFREFFQAIKDVDGAIDFKKSSDLKTEDMVAAYDIIILRTRDPDDFKTADEFVKAGKSVLVLADYYYCFDTYAGYYYAEIANKEFLERFGIRIKRGPEKFYNNLKLSPGNHLVSSDTTDMLLQHIRAEYVFCSRGATAVLYRDNDNKPWAAAWDGHGLNQGRVLVIPDTGFHWGPRAYKRGRDHFKFWRQALNWLKGGQTGK